MPGTAHRPTPDMRAPSKEARTALRWPITGLRAGLPPIVRRVERRADLRRIAHRRAARRAELRRTALRRVERRPDLRRTALRRVERKADLRRIAHRQVARRAELRRIAARLRAVP